MFFPDLPLNSGFYRALTVDLGPSGRSSTRLADRRDGLLLRALREDHELVFELWSELMPERAIACCPNIEYLLVGGRDGRYEERPIFMWYDWMVGGWGGRNGKDGSNATAPIFGVGDAVQPFEGQERLCPGAHDRARDPHRLRRARAVPRRLRREKGGIADGGQGHGDVVLLRPRPLGHVGHPGRPAVDPARRLAQPGRRRGALPRRDLLERADRAGRRVHAAVGRRRRLRRPARARPGGASARTSSRAMSPSSARSRTTASSCAVDADLGEYEVDARGDRARAGAHPRERDAAGSRRTRRTSLRATAPASSTSSIVVRQYGVILDWGAATLLPRRPSSSGRCSNAAPWRTGRRPLGRCPADQEPLASAMRTTLGGRPPGEFDRA